MLKRENPRTVIKLQIDDKNKFEYLFIALAPCISYRHISINNAKEVFPSASYGFCGYHINQNVRTKE